MPVPMAGGGVCKFEFAELCARETGAADFKVGRWDFKVAGWDFKVGRLD